MSGSDSESGTPASAPPPTSAPPPASAPLPKPSSATRFQPTKDSKLSKLIKEQTDKRSQLQAARAEANAQRFAAMDAPSKSRASQQPSRRATNVPCKAVGSITFFVEGAEALKDVPVPSTGLLLTLKEQGFGVVAVHQKTLEIRRDMTHQDILDFIQEHLPLAFEATTAAIDAWHDAHPDADSSDAPPFFRLLAQQGKRLKLVGPTKPTGADLQAVITSASNWYDKKLFLTSGMDISMHTSDEVETWQPCMLRTLLADGAAPGPDPEEGNDASYEEPVTSNKRKRASDDPTEHGAEPRVTRSKRQKQASPVDLTVSEDEQPKAGPSGTHGPPTLGTTTLDLTGFGSPPKRLRQRVAYGAE